ncbi:hypothetical protein [Nocardioides sp. LHG3406-4]|uniref:hypothetical protein n=1 Tax=Nocardioides sp. LHG3406-4 TaxID=2804575 RepID=UPI003CFA393B
MSEYGAEAGQDDPVADGLPAGEHVADETVTSPDTGSRYAPDGDTEWTLEDESNQDDDAVVDDFSDPLRP